LWVTYWAVAVMSDRIAYVPNHFSATIAVGGVGDMADQSANAPVSNPDWKSTGTR
jgi:hypothetical protein